MLKVTILRVFITDVCEHDIIHAFVGGSIHQGTSTIENDITTNCNFVTVIVIDTSIKQSTSRHREY